METKIYEISEISQHAKEKRYIKFEDKEAYEEFNRQIYESDGIVKSENKKWWDKDWLSGSYVHDFDVKIGGITISNTRSGMLFSIVGRLQQEDVIIFCKNKLTVFLI